MACTKFKIYCHISIALLTGAADSVVLKLAYSDRQSAVCVCCVPGSMFPATTSSSPHLSLVVKDAAGYTMMLTESEA